MSNYSHSVNARTTPKNDTRDFFPTPPVATIALMERERFAGTIWEPACGDGMMSEVLLQYNKRVVSTDLNDYGYGQTGLDFLDRSSHPMKKVRNIVTNPPFSLQEQFIDMALKVADRKVAMLGRLTFLISQRRYPMFTGTPLSKIYVFSFSLPYLPYESTEWKRAGVFSHIWMVWEHGHSGPPTIHWINKEQL